MAEETLTNLKRKLQEIFKCPVCLAVPRVGPILQCHEGHAVCQGKSWTRSLFLEICSMTMGKRLGFVDFKLVVLVSARFCLGNCKDGRS